MILDSMLQHSAGMLFGFTAVATVAYGLARVVASLATHFRKPRPRRR